MERKIGRVQKKGRQTKKFWGMRQKSRGAADTLATRLPQSPDLNIIGNIWQMITRKLHKNTKFIKSEQNIIGCFSHNETL